MPDGGGKDKIVALVIDSWPSATFLKPPIALAMSLATLGFSAMIRDFDIMTYECRTVVVRDWALQPLSSRRSNVEDAPSIGNPVFFLEYDRDGGRVRSRHPLGESALMIDA